ncbi:hypothetical protein K469DRAFT_721514 [Zopfia rhizophila CBS 207.26]|uniref:Uncharacterized protein n=1 Tax=Zopfia rhizophila CBS 207.26 TaxID=1314779 RepID=A0A6A6EEY5_9PEZI|nr:hypothetical protein K469DRAFT_721514 [Zopfia rhizophila CBS 207.26]
MDHEKDLVRDLLGICMFEYFAVMSIGTWVCVPRTSVQPPHECMKWGDLMDTLLNLESYMCLV